VLLKSVRQYCDAPGGGPAVGDALADDEPVAEALADGVGLDFGSVVIPFFAASASSCDV
jgi:hypothetical protein